MPRFFTDSPPAGTFLVAGENGRHIVRSLRMRPGEELTLCDGQGRDYFCVIERCEEAGAWVRVTGEAPSRGEAKTRVTVCQCWPKGDKLETVVQKSVELGAAEILPVLSARCVARPDPKSMQKKTERLQKIALEAAQQSERGIVPTVSEPLSLPDALTRAAGEGTVLFCYEKGTQSLKAALQSAGERLFLFVGPEGGFAPEEAALAERLGAPLLTLGPRILRTETAAPAVLAAVLYQRGDWDVH